MLCWILEPGVVIGRHRDGAVAKLRLQARMPPHLVMPTTSHRWRRTGSPRGCRGADLDAGEVRSSCNATRPARATRAINAAVARQVGCALDICATTRRRRSCGTRSLVKSGTATAVRDRRGGFLAQAPDRRHADHRAHAELFNARCCTEVDSRAAAWCCSRGAREMRLRDAQRPVMRARTAPRTVSSPTAPRRPNSRMAYKPLPPMMPIMACCAS